MNEPSINFLDLSKNQRKSVPSNHITICVSGPTRRIVFNKEVTKSVQGGAYTFMRVGFSDVSSDLYFVFCKKQTPDSMPVTFNKNHIAINSKYIVETLLQKWGLESRTHVLKISGNISNSTEYLTYRISKQQ